MWRFSDIQNTSLTLDKELNFLIYRMPSYVITYRSYKVLSLLPFLAHPVFLYCLCCKQIRLSRAHSCHILMIPRRMVA